MSIVQWNIRGLKANREQIRVLLRDAGASIMCLQETKIGEESVNLGVNYSFYRSPPYIGARAQGGTGFVVHKSVNHKSVPLNTILQACAIQIFTNKWITLCSLYLEPSLEDHLVDACGRPRRLQLGDLQDLIDQLPQPYILMGDFNAKHTLWGSAICDRWGDIIDELVSDNDVILMNDGSPTRYDVYHNSFSAIDLTLCSTAVRLDYQWSVDQDNHGSDHFPIHLKYVQNLPSPCLPRWKTSEANWGLYCSNTKVHIDYCDFSSPIEAYEHLSNIMMDKAMEHIPRTTGMPGRPVVPWWNRECAISRKVTRACYHRYKRYPCEANKIAYCRARAKQKRIIKSSKRESFRQYINGLNANTPATLVWNRIKKLQGKFVPSPLPVISLGDSLISKPGEVAEVLAQHFASISSYSNYSPEFQTIRNSTTIIPPNSTNNEAYNLPFSMKEMENALQLSSPTSPGEDDITYAMMSHLPRCSKAFLLEAFNGMWDMGISHKTWKTSLIVPVLKPGKNPNLPQSYRPIALTSCSCKLYERMVNARLVWVLESKRLLSNRQFGFRKNRCTTDPLCMLTREVQNAFARQHQAIAVLFDLEKAYDTTWRAGILQQLAAWKIGGNMFRCLQDFLSNRLLKVRVGSEFSSEYAQEEGLPQGSVLSVTLFSIAINSLMEHVPVGVQALVFADDYAIICSGSTAVEVARKIQETINRASNWAKSRGFRFSSQKTKAIRFSKTRRREEIPTLFLGDVILPYEDKVKYLGMVLDKQLTFLPHITEVIEVVKRRINILKMVSRLSYGADRKILLNIYTALCLSKIDYGCQIYGSACKTNLQKLDVVHNMALRICTGAYRTSPIDSLYVDSGVPPLYVRREELGLRYFSRVLTNPQNPNHKFVKNPVNLSVNKPRSPKPFEVRLQDSAREVGLLPSHIAEIRPPKFPPWDGPPVDICPILYDKKWPILKTRAEFIRHQNQHATHISIYTDGSKSAEGVGFGIVSDMLNIGKKLPLYISIFTAELYAIFYFLKYIFNHGCVGERYMIYTDSQSVLASLRKLMPSHPLVIEVQEWLVLLHSRRRIRVGFCWVPGHVGVDGNERADAAAKEAAESGRSDVINVPHGDFKPVFRSYVRNKWQEHWRSLTSNAKLQAIKPVVSPWKSSYQTNRRHSVVLTRLRIGHSFLTHRYLMTSGEERRVPQCPTCRSDISIKHILIDCVTYNTARVANGLDGRSIQEVLGDDADVASIMKFLYDISLYFEI